MRVALLMALFSCPVAIGDQPTSTRSAPVEYSYQQACRDWTEIPQRITVLGAPHSPFHAAVYSDGSFALAGTAGCEADLWLLKHRPDRLLVCTGYGEPPDFVRSPQPQELLEGSLPAIVTHVEAAEQVSNGLRFRQEVIAHLLDAQEALTALEPLIVRCRLTAHNPTPSELKAVLWFQLSALEHKPGVDPEATKLMFASHMPQPIPYAGGVLTLQGDRVLTDQGRLRARIEAPSSARLSFHRRESLPTTGEHWRAVGEKEPLDQLLRIELRVAPKADVTLRLTVPAVPLDPEATEQLVADDFESAWNRTLSYWRGQLKSADRWHIAEPQLLDMTRTYPWQVMVKMDREPGTGLIMPKVNALLYEGVWGHITALECNALDYLGYHDLAEQYLQPFLDWQGQPRTTCKADGIDDWSGFLGGDLRYAWWNWATHHGYLMWACGEHYLLTRNQAWFDRVRSRLLKAANWTIEQIDRTRKSGPSGEKALNWGLFPASVSTDLTQHIDNAAFNDAWMYRGLVTVAQAFAAAGMPAATHIQERAEAYRRDIRAAWRRAIRECEPQTLSNGARIPFVPGLLHMRDWRDAMKKEMGPGYLVFYLMDTGPLHLGQCGVFGAGDPEMEWALQLIREGPAEVRFLTHGVSTCEILFAPQFEYYLSIDDPVRAIEVLYSLMAGSMSRRTFSGWEFRGGIQFMPVAIAEAVRQSRLMLVRETPNGGLWLAQATPRAWLASGKQIQVREAPTRYGPLNYSIRSDIANNSVHAKVTLPTRQEPRTVRLRLREPSGRSIRALQINGRPWSRFKADTIELPTSGQLDIIAEY